MPTPALTEEKCQEAIDLVEDCLKEGYAPPDAPHGNTRRAMTEAGKRSFEKWGLTERGLGTRLQIAKARFGMAVDWSLWRPPQYQAHKSSKSQPTGGRAPLPHNIAEPEGDPVTVLAIGDTHDDPRLPDKTRFEWFGRFARDQKVDRIVQVGDWGTWDSVSRHEDRSTIRGRGLPSFEDDLASCRMSLMAFNRGLDGYDCPKDITLGNHEDRVKVYENLNPVMEGGMYLRLCEAFAQYGWRHRDYREYLFIEGVGFTHVPQTIMGKPYGGKTLNPIGNDATFSIVFGHSHKGAHLSVPKIGPDNKIDILNLGCALPHGHVEDYAKLSTTGWQYGVYILRLQSGQIVSHRHVSMLELQEMYAEDIAA